MILYHFTSGYHVKEILKARVIRLTVSNLHPPTGKTDTAALETLERGRGIFGVEAGAAEVVWLTADPNRKSQKWGQPKTARGLRWSDKTEFRITVNVPKGGIIGWNEWARNNGMPGWWRKQIIRAGGNHKSWYLVTRPISTAEWVCVERFSGKDPDWVPLLTGEQIRKAEG